MLRLTVIPNVCFKISHKNITLYTKHHQNETLYNDVFFLCLTSFGRVIAVDAPFNNNILTTSTSADLMAKNKTGMGTPDEFGSAPRRNNKSIVFFIRSFLFSKTNVHQSKQLINKNFGTGMDSQLSKIFLCIFL